MAKTTDNPENKGRKKKSVIRLLCITFPVVGKTLLRQYPIIIGLLLFSFLLGVVPTVKSQLESNLINFANEILDRESINNFSDFAKKPISTKYNSDNSKDSSLPEKITYMFTNNMTVYSGVFAFIICIVLGFFLEFGNQWMRANIQKQLFSKLRLAAISKRLNLDPSEIPQAANIPGQYATAIHQGANNVGDTYGYLLDVGQYIFALCTTLFLLISKSWVFALGCFFVVVCQVSISFLQAKALSKGRNVLDTKRNELWGRTDDILSKRDILVANEEDIHYADKLNSFTLEYAETDRMLQVAEAKYDGYKDLVSDFGKLSILLIAVIVVAFIGNKAITGIGDIYFLLSIYTRLLVPATNLLRRYDSIKRSEATSETFLQLLEIKIFQPNGTKRNITPTLPAVSGNIQFLNVSFSYSANNPRHILNNCSFNIPGGKTTLIVGPSGCGKTTIARLLLKFWSASDGKILLDGIELSQINSTEVRSYMSYVAQEDYIVEDSIKENLLWGKARSYATDELLLEILDRVGIAKPENCNDLLSCHAGQLSTGQKQRLSIARMLLDSSNIAILDEPLAGVDVFTMREMIPLFNEFIRSSKKTIIIISHRLSFISIADHIVVLNENGCITEEGPVSELQTKGHIFYELQQAALNEIQKENRLVRSTTELQHL
jgi:ABC-type multidrug transport system fused ATPase/permease subunit